MLGGIKVYVLPDNAICLKSDDKSPMDLDACPCGRTACVPDGCIYYLEVEHDKG